MSRSFVILEEGKYSQVDQSATVVKNQTSGPFYVNDDGGWLPSMGVAAVDASCELCAKGIEEGKLVVLRPPSEPKSQKSNVKTVPESKTEVTQTVASAKDNGSVQ